jgi:hypothetical protein
MDVALEKLPDATFVVLQVATITCTGVQQVDIR